MPTFRSRLLKLLLFTAWFGTVSTSLWMLFSYTLPEDLSAGGMIYSRLAEIAFFGRVFTFHTGIALATAAACGLLFRRRRLLTMSSIAALACLVPTVYACRPRQPSLTSGPTVRVMSANLLYENDDAAAVLAQVKAANPDVLLLEEYEYHWDTQLRDALQAIYPYHVTEPRNLSLGLAIYSKLPFMNPPQPDMDELREQIRAEVSVSGHTVAVYAVHPTSPKDSRSIVHNRRQTLDLIQQFSAEKNPTIMAGDWNFTAETANAAAVRAARLTDAFDYAGAGRASSWPALPRWRAWMPGVRIDHVYLSPGLVCSDYHTGGFDGSDHWPIIADVRFADPTHAAR